MSDNTLDELYTQLKGRFPNSSTNFAILKLNPQTADLNKLYLERIETHNTAFQTNPRADAGFDVVVPDRTVFTENITSKFVDMRLKAEMFYCDITANTISPSAFVVHPRSSISKTPLMFANHTGIIDSGYRGSLIGAFRWLRGSDTEYVVDQHVRLLQICHPTLCPIFVVAVNDDELSTTMRGAGGFGSTGL